MMTNRLLAQDNHLFELARSGRLRWPESLKKLYPIAVLICGLLIPILGQLIIGIPLVVAAFVTVGPEAAMAFIQSNGGGSSAGHMAILILGFAPIYFLVWLWLWLFESRPFWTVGLERGQVAWKYGRGLLVGLLMFSISVGIFAVFGFTEIESIGLRVNGAAVLGGALLVLLGWVVQGAAEEVLARGFLFPVIGTRWGTVTGIVASSSVFALLHLLNPNLSSIAMLNLFLFGAFTALYALYEGGLWGVFAIHSIWNWAQGNLYGFEVSGQEVGSAIVFDLMETGPDWLTGGPFGPEGGLAVTLVLIVSSALVFVAHRRRG